MSGLVAVSGRLVDSGSRAVRGGQSVSRAIRGFQARSRPGSGSESSRVGREGTYKAEIAMIAMKIIAGKFPAVIVGAWSSHLQVLDSGEPLFGVLLRRIASHKTFQVQTLIRIHGQNASLQVQNEKQGTNECF